MSRVVPLETLSDRLLKFRKVMEEKQFGAYIVRHDDAHQSEYIAACDERVAYLSGFDGSAGTCVVTPTHALLWTDGRYFLQAQNQFGKEWYLMKDREPNTPTVKDWLLKNAKDVTVGVDPAVTSIASYMDYTKSGLKIAMEEQNLVDAIWDDDKEYPRPKSGIYSALGSEVAKYENRLPMVLWKAIKNEVECEGAREAHREDGLAKTRYMYWLEHQLADLKRSDLDEVDVADKLEEFRKKSPNFRGLSFTTISSFGANAAVIHYSPTKGSARCASDKEMYLVDSGGQYWQGTTDVTRTVHLGTPTAAEKDAYTRVLRGHIALAKQKFPVGTVGQALDALARQYLWQGGMDFRHGTGHGVGAYLCVHEGPQNIGPPGRPGIPEPLKPGMIISNEPGYYKDGEFGIRIESLMLVRESQVEHALVPGQHLLEMETLTLVPIQKKLINTEDMNADEIEWLNDYHARVLANAEPHIKDEAELAWLRDACAPLVETTSPRKRRGSSSRAESIDKRQKND
ncbi:Xaa-Pro aminopeptidase, putative [Perkinsus marinus ATCC 50983]|uniref:Xaa-Pro aminopeptidase, putative n=1 Tax=Perkinsus marinus (strain ATCC 50983 / TXsc) TaxID=423536 RepID=C5LJE6_PERM5|nr:Xaa-Pro aminopeptidase, putative [Perkinsus marinus ATCC 50983]EER03146.1 Xaa-Pro aminopeptidase, putative [Perkinsus marinus ATCC 50983]|eukprot:XP_002771330.1 Xaa-Pro aminopeptidase, putative [Perkinsus marinus ATCC 50983]